MPNKAVRSFFILLLPTMLLFVGCGNQPADSTNISPSEPVPSAEDETDWGREISLDELIAMTRGGQIQEIQWHVMPNILRAMASDGRIFHFRNENKGVDLRNTLINAGVKIGKGGVSFRHFF